jgi:hypothetical protein
VWLRPRDSRNLNPIMNRVVNHGRPSTPFPSPPQLRDDLMTMLIAGHETTAAVLTWALFCLVQASARNRTQLHTVSSPLAHHSSLAQCTSLIAHHRSSSLIIAHHTSLITRAPQSPEALARVLREVDGVVGEREPCESKALERATSHEQLPP